MSCSYYVYILANPKCTVLYIGVTNNLERRIQEHRAKEIHGFTKKYNCHKLLYYEETGDVRSAIEREKEMKGWKRIKKNTLITTQNPNWVDLSYHWNI